MEKSAEAPVALAKEASPPPMNAMEGSVELGAVVNKPGSTQAVAKPEKSAEVTVDPPKEGKVHFLNRMFKYSSYPVALLSGLWVFEREVHDMVYQNLKRYHAFDDILAKLEPLNKSNIQSRIHNDIPKEGFLLRSLGTKSAYSKAVGERMAHMGLGDSLKDFPAKWGYIDKRSGRRAAITQGLTAFGISIGAMLTIANSKSLIDYFADRKEKAADDERTR
jgi:hypothetical protein